MIEHAEANQQLASGKFGIRRGHSTIHAVEKLFSDICWHQNDRQSVSLCLNNNETAFHTVWLNAPPYMQWENLSQIFAGIQVLSCTQFPAHNTQMLKSQLFNKQFCISSGELSIETEFNRLSSAWNSTGRICVLYLLKMKLINNLEKIIAYADDFIVYSSG